MKPLPKWVGYITLLAGLFGAGGALAGAIPGKYGLVIAAIAQAVQSISHSLNGTGGKPS